MEKLLEVSPLSLWSGLGLDGVTNDLMLLIMMLASFGFVALLGAGFIALLIKYSLLKNLIVALLVFSVLSVVIEIVAKSNAANNSWLRLLLPEIPHQ